MDSKIYKNQFLGLSEKEWNNLLNSNNSELENLRDSQEKLRRFVSFHNRNLYLVSKKRFQSNAIFQLENIFKLLTIKTKKTNLNKHLPKNIPIDPSLLNASLFCFEALKKLNSTQLKVFSDKLEKDKKELHQFLEKEYQRGTLETESFKSDFLSSFDFDKFKLLDQFVNQPVVIISPSRFSLYSLTTIALCLELRIPIKAIIIKKFSVKRFANEFKRDGFKLIKKIYRKLILKSDENVDKIFISFRELCYKLTGGFSDIGKIAKFKEIPFIFVNEFEESQNFLLKNTASIALFTGGGLLKKSFLENFKLGIINVHMGILPFYKGMDVVESPLTEGRFNCVGLTSHVMEKKLDNGPIIDIYKVSPFEYKSLGSFRNEIALIMPFLLIDSYTKLSKNNESLTSQIDLGRQYYFINDDLKKIINKVFSKNFKNNERTRINQFIHQITKKFKIQI